MNSFSGEKKNQKEFESVTDRDVIVLFPSATEQLDIRRLS